MRVIITEKNIGDWAAVYVANKILAAKPTAEKPFVLGLPTGGTPLAMYKRLIQFYKDGILSFENVITFNMDEYVGLSPANDQSYRGNNIMLGCVKLDIKFYPCDFIYFPLHSD